jgi:hypothetical protein
MIRKLLVIAAAVAMPAAAMAGVTAVGSAGMASAKALPPVAVTCTLGGSVTFAKPGLSFNGTITNKTVEVSKSVTGAVVGSPAACSTKAIKAKIVSTTTQCWSVLPTLTSKTVFTGGTAASGAAPECSTNAKGVAAGSGATEAGVKEAIKDQFFFDTASSLASAGVADIVASFPNGIATADNGTKVTLGVTTAGTGSILPGGVCGTDIGFALSGGVFQLNTTTPVVIGSSNATYTLNICLTGDTGTGTTGAFFTDFLGAAGGDTSITIATAILGSDSSLAIS